MQPIDETHRIRRPKENDEEPLPQGGLRRLSNTHPSLRCLFFKVGPGCLAQFQGKWGVRLTEAFKTSALILQTQKAQGRAMSFFKTQFCDSSASPGEKLGKRDSPRSQPILPSETPDLFVFPQKKLLQSRSCREMEASEQVPDSWPGQEMHP